MPPGTNQLGHFCKLVDYMQKSLEIRSQLVRTEEEETREREIFNGFDFISTSALEDELDAARDHEESFKTRSDSPRKTGSGGGPVALANGCTDAHPDLADVQAGHSPMPSLASLRMQE